LSIDWIIRTGIYRAAPSNLGALRCGEHPPRLWYIIWINGTGISLVKHLPNGDYPFRNTFAQRLTPGIVKLLPEGHLENEYHFQDQPAESGQKPNNKISILII